MRLNYDSSFIFCFAGMHSGMPSVVVFKLYTIFVLFCCNALTYAMEAR